MVEQLVLEGAVLGGRESNGNRRRCIDRCLERIFESLGRQYYLLDFTQEDGVLDDRRLALRNLLEEAQRIPRAPEVIPACDSFDFQTETSS